MKYEGETRTDFKNMNTSWPNLEFFIPPMQTSKTFWNVSSTEQLKQRGYDLQVPGGNGMLE